MVFPDIAPGHSYTVTKNFQTLAIGPTQRNITQRIKKQTRALHDFSLKYNLAGQAAVMKPLWDFYNERNGRFESFAFFDFELWPHTGVSIGTGNGAATQFNLAAKETSGRVVYVAGVQKTEGTDYTFSAGTGTDGQDRITFAVAPGNGAAVTADYTGRKYYPTVIFGEDNMSRELFTNVIYRTGLALWEVTA